jgi:acyl-CoA thioester hydrolase
MFTLTVQPRFGNIDALGHINNIVVAEWFELARNSLFRIFDPDLDPSNKKFPLIMAHADYDFVNQMFFQHDVEIHTYISRIGTKSFTVYHEAWQHGKLGAKGNAVIVYFDFETQQSKPIPNDKKALLGEHPYTQAV